MTFLEDRSCPQCLLRSIQKGNKMPFSQSILPEFEEEMKNTRKLLERVPDGKFEFQPHPKSMTLGRLATHVAELPAWAIFTLEQEVFDLQPDFKPHIATSRAEVL